MPIEEGRPARAAVKIRGQRLSLLQAVAANRNPGDFVEGPVAQPAFIGEEEVQKTANRPFGDAPWRREAASDRREQATREDPPPGDISSLQQSTEGLSDGA